MRGANTQSISHVFSNTPNNSPLRQFIIDGTLAVFIQGAKTKMRVMEPGIGEFYYELAEAAFSVIRKAKVPLHPCEMPPCHYYENRGQPEGNSCV